MSKDLNFEERIKKLEEIAKTLESDDLSLDESVEKFEEGMKLSQECKEILDNAEKKIKKLVDGEEEDLQSYK